MTIKKNNIEYKFSVRSHPGKFSQSKQKEVGKCKDLDVSYDGQFASVTMGLKPTKNDDIPETPLDCVARLAERIGVKLTDAEWKAISTLLG